MSKESAKPKATRNPRSMTVPLPPGHQAIYNTFRDTGVVPPALVRSMLENAVAEALGTPEEFKEKIKGHIAALLG